MDGSAPANNVHLIVGEDDFIADRAALKILDAAVPRESRDNAIERVDGAAQNAEAQLASLRECERSIDTPPFLEPVKATWWRGVSFLPGGGRGGRVSEEVKTALERFAARLAENPLPENQTLVITAPKCLKTSIFAKTFARFAETVSFAAPDGRGRSGEALSRLASLAEEAGVSFAPGVDDMFLAKTGGDSRTMASELAKLRTYLGEGNATATAADVSEITSANTEEPEFWDLTDAVGRRDVRGALNVFSKFAGAGSKFGILLATVLEKFFRELIVLRDAAERGWLTSVGWSRNIPEEALAALAAAGTGPGAERRAWILGNRLRQARAFTPAELRAAHFRFLSIREKLVSGGVDEMLAVEIARTTRNTRNAR